MWINWSVSPLSFIVCHFFVYLLLYYYLLLWYSFLTLFYYCCTTISLGINKVFLILESWILNLDCLNQQSGLVWRQAHMLHKPLSILSNNCHFKLSWICQYALYAILGWKFGDILTYISSNTSPTFPCSAAVPQSAMILQAAVLSVLLCSVYSFTVQVCISRYFALIWTDRCFIINQAWSFGKLQKAWCDVVFHAMLCNLKLHSDLILWINVAFFLPLKKWWFYFGKTNASFPPCLPPLGLAIPTGF